MSSVEEQVRELLLGLGPPRPSPFSAQAPLELDSLSVLLLHERLEEAFGLRIRAREVIPEHFGTIAALVRLIEAKLAEDER